MTTAILSASSRTRLTARQEAFCVNYFSGHLNATQAAIKAGYSPKTAPWIAAENLHKPQIAERIADLQAGVASAKQMPERERREVLANIAREVHFGKTTAGDRIRAVDTLNKLDKLYASEGATINFNEIKILVVREETKVPPTVTIEQVKE